MSKNSFGKKPNQGKQDIPDSGAEEQLDEEQGPDTIIETLDEPESPVTEQEPETKPTPVQEIITPMTTQTKNLEPTKVDPLILFLTQYQKEITTTKSEQVAAKTQQSLFNKVLELLSKESFEEARVGLNTILKHLHNGRKDGLTEVNLFRGGSHWDGTPEDYNTFRRLMWLFIETANPQTRKSNVSKVDLTPIEKGLSTQQYNNLISFYG